MNKSLWMFIGSVPEDGDCCLVWAADAAEAMSEGRRLSGYAPEDDPDHTDDDFEVMPATTMDILEWSPALLNRSSQSERYESGALDTAEVRQYLTSMLRTIQAMNGCAEDNG